MSLLQDILEWTQVIPSWQSDAVARLLSKQTLSAEDVEDAYALLKSAHGIPDPKGRTPKPLAAEQIPTASGAAQHVELLAIKNLLNVNAIAKDQRLPVGSTGLTLIYGDNGTGKSGYSRVLKKACRARDQAEPILPNAHSAAAKVNAKAEFEIKVDGVAHDVQWTDGAVAPPELSSFAIFDSRCARAYLDTEDDFSYVPYGLDVFEGLAKLCRQLKVRLDEEHSQAAPDLLTFVPLQGDTTVGQLIAGLSANTAHAKIEALATLTPEERATHLDLDRNLREGNAKEKATQLRARARRLSAIASAATEQAAHLSDAVTARLRELSDSNRAAQLAATLAAQQFKEGGNLLPGTGGEAWRALFEAARKFALESHPGKIFPDLGAAAPCPLCQQPLADGAARLVQFEAYVQAEAEKAAQARRAELAAVLGPFASRTLLLGVDDVTYSEVEAIDPQLAKDVRLFESALAVRREAIKTAVQTNVWGGATSALNSPAARLLALAAAAKSQADTLDMASDEKGRALLQAQFSELDARIKLLQVKAAVDSAVDKLAYQAKLAACQAAVKTTAISLKASELTEKVVSNELADALNAEFKRLGVGNLQVVLQSRADRGRTLHKLILQLPQSTRPADILSEGEQRAVAIASFLAEVSLVGGTGGIIFDDPVSSLDHRRRERVAARLASEAAKRQVIIFTHDIYFMCLLAEQTKDADVPMTVQSVMRRPEGFGIAVPDVPFEGKNTLGRIGALKNQHQIITKLYKIGDESEYRRQAVDAYEKLRIAWERAVEEVLLRNVVLRFRKGVETQRLIEVSVEDDDYARVNSGMKKCSNYAHDKAVLGGIAIPDPDELLSDITALETWRAQVEERSKATGKHRKLASSVLGSAKTSWPRRPAPDGQ
jgi:energy-coupling factor transporter ATP-binding protein EcfA2